MRSTGSVVVGLSLAVLLVAVVNAAEEPKPAPPAQTQVTSPAPPPTPAPEAGPPPAASQPPPSSPGAVARPATLASASSEGFTVSSADAAFKLQLKGLVQFDGRFYASDPTDALTDTLVVRRARPILQGTVARYFDFNFTPDFGSGTAVIQDAYFVARIWPALAVEVGKFKPPIGVEHLQPDASVAFPERSLTSNVAPNRDVGAQISGVVAKGVLAYAGGVFDGAGDGASVEADTNDAKSVVGRLVLSPFRARRSVLSGLAIALAGSTEKQSGNATLAAIRSGGQNPFFSWASGVAPAGPRRRIWPDLSFFSGPFGLIAEYVASKARLVRTVTSGGTTTSSGPFDFENRAWQATATVFLTGDRAGYDAPKLRRPLDPAKGQWGALQLVARINGVDGDPDIFAEGFADPAKSARRARAWAVGLVWLLNRNVKQVVGFERTRFTGGAAAGGDRPTENAIVLRSQLTF